MTTASAPGKVYLFGEHAVVYGEPAVPCAIERRARVTVDRRPEGLRIHADDLSLSGFTVEYQGTPDDHPDIDVSESLVEAAMGYVTGAIEQVRDATDAPDAGFEVRIESDIPLGAGLGSSAAVVVAAIDAATRELGVELPVAKIADLAYQVEYDVQDGQASRADTFCATMGGGVRIEGDDCRTVETPTLPFVIGYDGGSGDTGELVAGVRALKNDYGFAADTVGAIGDLVREGESLLDRDPEDAIPDLGRLMNVNHGLLSALGVSSRALDAMVWAARDAGAAGAKLTGAGGGGCIVALDPTDGTETALEHTPECEATFRAELAETGLRRES
jgi:mevalonate kinase